MVAIDINAFAEANWSGYKKSVTDISKAKHSSLIEDETELYCFDDISNSLYSGSNKPSSADALIIDGKTIQLVEFKSGFKNKITRENFKESEGKCLKLGTTCEDYWKLFWANRKKEINELTLIIRMKAIESYITLEKKIFQGYRPFDQAFRLQFCVVIDEDSVDGMEETLAELSGRSETTGNPYASIKASLKRYINCRDCSGTPYFYDEVKVLSVTDFENYLRLKYEK